MSLLDTIKGAREEAQEAGTLLSSKKDEGTTAAAEGDAPSTSAGFSRRSTARAKPTREAAGSVRTSAKSQAEMSKEEKKAAREAKRTEEDLLYEAKKAYLNKSDAYRFTQRVWWGLLGGGMVCSVISFLIMRNMQSNGGNESMATASVVLMVLAYVLIIGAFIYDLIKVRPLRNEANEKLAGMSKKRLNQLIAEEEERKAAKK